MFEPGQSIDVVLHSRLGASAHAGLIQGDYSTSTFMIMIVGMSLAYTAIRTDINPPHSCADVDCPGLAYTRTLNCWTG